MIEIVCLSNKERQDTRKRLHFYVISSDQIEQCLNMKDRQSSVKKLCETKNKGKIQYPLNNVEIPRRLAHSRAPGKRIHRAEHKKRCSLPEQLIMENTIFEPEVSQSTTV